MARKQNTRQPNKIYVLVTEGKATEPLYFEGLRKALIQNHQRQERIRIEKIHPVGYHGGEVLKKSPSTTIRLPRP